MRTSSVWSLAGLVLLVAVLSTGCGSNPTETVAGKWSGRCATNPGPTETVVMRFSPNGAFSSSSSGRGGRESTGTFQIPSTGNLDITNQAGTQAYRYTINNNTLTMTTSAGNRTETCNLGKQ